MYRSGEIKINNIRSECCFTLNLKVGLKIMFKNVLLGIDGSGRSREMMNMLLPLPSFAQTQITLLHVIPSQVTTIGVEEHRQAGERIIARESEALKLGEANSYNTRLEEGDPKDVVCRVADELKPDFLVMGSRGLGRLRSILANSVSQYVFQLASVPMLLVKDDVYIQTLRRVMVALDGSAAAKSCLDFAINLVKGSDIEVQLVHVSGKEKTEDVVLKEGATRLQNLGINYKLFSRQGEAGPEICACASAENSNLLLIASPDRRPSIARGLPDLDRLLGSSLSDYVRVHATCPVLLTRTVE